MRWLKFSLSSVLCLSLSLLILSGGTIKAHALSGGQYLSNSDSRLIFGETIDVRYWNGSEYIDTTASYFGNYQLGQVHSTATYESVYQGAPCLVYRAEATTNTNIQYVTVRPKPRYSVFDTEQLHTFIAVISGSNIGSAFQSPSWDWSIGHFENHDFTSDGSSRAWVNIGGAGYTFVPIDYTSQSKFSAYSLDATFQGNSSDPYLFIALGCPYVDSDATFASGTFQTSSGEGSSSSGGSGDTNVYVDMTETNGILSTVVNAITSLPSTIVNGISSIFVPEEGFLDEKLEDLQDHFAWYEEIKEAGDIFYTAFSANNFSDNPVVVIGSARSATTGGTYFSDGSFVLDMNDFAPYRSSVQTIITIFLWLMFFWRLYCRLPDIISGTGMIITTGSKIDASNAKDNSFESGDAGSDINSSIDHIFDDL